MDIRALESPFGAEVLGLDLTARLTQRELEAARRAVAENVVLCFRDQKFDRPERFHAAVRNLGEPMPPVTSTYRLPEFDAIEELTNKAIDKRTGDRTPLRRGGSRHTDHSNLECPPKATVLHAIEVPEEGGNTEFTSLYLAYEALPDETRETIRGCPGPRPTAHLAGFHHCRFHQIASPRPRNGCARTDNEPVSDHINTPPTGQIGALGLPEVLLFDMEERRRRRASSAAGRCRSPARTRRWGRRCACT